MIHLRELELLHWDIQAHQKLELSAGVTLLTGENGSGKTSVLDALKVALGARKLGSDRTVDGYLRRQGAAVAMIRVLVDNRRDPATHRRPFDTLGAFGGDVVTLAVVFERDDDEHRRSYFLLDGDVAPLGGGDHRRRRAQALSASDYRRRLERVGITARYLKLLCLPQGRIASFCSSDADALFDDLFDIIGGRDALLEWEARVRDVHQQEAELTGARKDLESARRSLHSLGRLAERYRQYARLAEQLAAVRLALPHARREQAERARVALQEAAARSEQALQRAVVELEQAERAGQELGATAAELKTELDGLQRARVQTDMGHQRLLREHATAAADLAHLERLKAAAAGIEPVDPQVLQAREEGHRVELATVDHRRGELATAIEHDDTELRELRQGKLAWPAEVDGFRAALRRAQLPHHLLAEVIDVRDPALSPALEGWLGRYRFAVLLQDPRSFDEAAALCRQHGYPHGVLAPDVRGHSPADLESALTGITVHEARYRPLVARLLRRVRVAEPERPFAPIRRVELLAADGFNLTRLDARVAKADKHYLGRAARERRERQLQQRLKVSRTELVDRDRERAGLLRRIEGCRQERRQQDTRLRWEAARDGWAAAAATEKELAGRVATADEMRKRLRTQVDAAHTRAGQLAQQQTEAAQRRRIAQQAVDQRRTERSGARLELGRAEAALGKLLADDIPELTDTARELLASGKSCEVLQAQHDEWLRRLDDYPADERNPDLPLNHQRQQREVEAVARNIDELRDKLKGTRNASEHAHAQYRLATRRVFRAYFSGLQAAAAELQFTIRGNLEQRGDGRFSCVVRVGVQDKPLVHHDSEALSGGQKAALSILMAMTAVSLETDSAGFFLVDEPFSASDSTKINELGRFLQRTGAQYLLSMPTSADLQHCEDWLRAVWLCTRTPGGYDAAGAPKLAPPVQMVFAAGDDGAPCP